MSKLVKLFGILQSNQPLSNKMLASDQISKSVQNQYHSIGQILLQLSACLLHEQSECRYVSELTLEKIVQICYDHEKHLERNIIGDNEKYDVLDYLEISEPLLGQPDHFAENEHDNDEMTSPLTGSSDMELINLSARERNKLKRKLKQKTPPASAFPSHTNDSKDSNTLVFQAKKTTQADPLLGISKWGLEQLFRYLLANVNSPYWFVRHGALVGIRNIQRVDFQWTQEELQHTMTKVFNVLLNDKFTDFVGDHIVCPVREACAQVFGACCQFAKDDLLQVATNCALKMVNGDYHSSATNETKKKRKIVDKVSWDSKHAGLLSIQYILVTRQDKWMTLWSSCGPVVLKGLEDVDDDVRSIAAQALCPIIKKLKFDFELDIMQLLHLLWEALLDLDDLSASTASIMELLSTLMELNQVQEYYKENPKQLQAVLPRILQFFRHALYSVRLATLRVIHSLNNVDEWVSIDFINRVFYNFILEDKTELLDINLQTWNSMVDLYPDVNKYIPFWFQLAFHPIGIPFESRLLNISISSIDTPMAHQDLGLVDMDVFIHNRLIICQALAHIYNKSPNFNFIYPYLHSNVAIQCQYSCYLLSLMSNYSKWCPDDLVTHLLSLLSNDHSMYEEVEKVTSRVFNIAGKLFTELDLQSSEDLNIKSPTIPQLLNLYPSLPDVPLVNNLKNELALFDLTVNIYRIRCHSMIANILINMQYVPEKKSLLIKSLMNSVKFEENLDLQTISCSSLISLIKLIKSTNPNIVDKILLNTCAFSCSDPSITLLLKEYADNEDIHAFNMILKEDLSNKKQKSEFQEFNVTKVETITRGSTRVFELLFKSFKLDDFPVLIQQMEIIENTNINQSTLDAFQIISTICPFSNSPFFLDILPRFIKFVGHTNTAVRNMAAKCIAMVCKYNTTKCMLFINSSILDLISSTDTCTRCGVIELIHYLITLLNDDLIPFVLLFILPVMGRMSDFNDSIRKMSSTCFASLIKLVPLDDSDDNDIPALLSDSISKQRDFLDQLLDSSKIKPYNLPIVINATLRHYQQEGLNWLYFLNKYNLHGILSDDMGLGKTLQCICIMSSDLHDKSANANSENTSTADKAVLNLIVCPSTVVGHWNHEILEYSTNLKPLLYTGLPSERTKLRSKFHNYNTLITSYEIIRNDIEHLNMNFNYCILDEGHVIRNSKTKITKACKLIKANHRLILSGTPIQNQIQELWSLFDFLMPGFLGSEAQFNSRYNNNNLELLHKQILPFLLRRLKEDVLQDLPPKIIQDHYCTLSPVQSLLYTQYGTNNKNNLEPRHVFSSLQYLRKLCSHPLLVMSSEQQKQYEVEHSCNLRDLEHAPKLLALQDLLIQCGINNDDQVSGHRVLIFCQLKKMIEIIEHDLFATKMPYVNFRRLDGDVALNKRHDVVVEFNSDPSIDVLLLTTKIGGLGLNLTGADTVIFVESDWNPMQDL
eukprot:NODE_7_length_48057_cov_0.322240.p1 type:complete len:1447 gc:universal NODE_7_length_48057_cov_0.322240:40324-44664(+)